MPIDDKMNKRMASPTPSFSRTVSRPFSSFRTSFCNSSFLIHF